MFLDLCPEFHVGHPVLKIIFQNLTHPLNQTKDVTQIIFNFWAKISEEKEEQEEGSIRTQSTRKKGEKASRMRIASLQVIVICGEVIILTLHYEDIFMNIRGA